MTVKEFFNMGDLWLDHYEINNFRSAKPLSIWKGTRIINIPEELLNKIVKSWRVYARTNAEGDDTIVTMTIEVE